MRTIDSSIPRRTLSELIALHHLEPTESSILTEGSSDRAFLQWFLDELGLTSVAVYEVSAVDVPRGTVDLHGEQNNNRGRVITACKELDRAGMAENQFIGVIDADFDHVLGSPPQQRLLVVTDYCCMEMYTWTEKILNKILRLYRNSLDKQPSTVIADMSPLLRRLFVYRATNAALGWNLEAVDWTKSAQLKDGSVTFDDQHYVDRYLQSNNRMREKDQFLREAERISDRLPQDSRFCINGHDLTDALFWYLRAHKGLLSVNAEAIRPALFGCLEHGDVQVYPMFQEIVRRLKQN